MGENYSNYYGLLFNCPFGNEVYTCVLNGIRKIGAKERLVYYEALTSNERRVLIKRHHECLMAREKKSLFHESQ